MTRPVLKVEMAFNSGYSTPAASRTWTDITAYVLQAFGVGISHGRTDELSVAGPNQLRQLVLDNSDGRFTAGLASSPYYPNVKLGRPVRVTSTPAGGSASVRHVGYADELPVEWPGVAGVFATAAVSAASRLARLAIGVELRSIVEEEILLDDPVAYYTLGEPEGATFASDTSGNAAANLVQAGSGTAVVFGTGTGPGTDGLTAATFAGGKSLQSPLPLLTPTAMFVECFFSTSASPGDAQLLFDFKTTAPQALPSLKVEADGTLQGSVGGVILTTATVVNDGATHHAAIVTQNGGPSVMYLDDVAVDTDATSVTLAALNSHVTIGAEWDTFAGKLIGVMAHVAWGFSTLSSTRIAAHSDAGLTGFAGETPAARLTRYAAFAGVPAAEISFETGDLPGGVAHIDTTGKTALAAMREVETTEGGVLFDARDGTSTFHDRSHRYGATSVITLDVDAGEVQPDYTPQLDNFGLANDVTATGSTGITGRATDADSIADHGYYRESLDLATSNADEPYQAASWRVGNHAEPAVRVPTLTVELAKMSAARQAQVLAVTVGDRITVSNLMTQSDAATKSFYVEGYTEDIGEGTHRIKFNLSPAAVSDVWILGDATYGVLGTTTRLAY